MAAYYWTRILQRQKVTGLTLGIGGMARTTIPNPPGILKCYATPQGMKIFADDRSLQAVRKLVRSARTFWDVGANCGLFSLFGRGENPDLFIVSIEASTLRYQTLSSNWALQPSERWLCLHTAVGDRGVETHLSRHGSGFGHIIRPRLAPRWRSGQRRIGATVLESDGHDQRYGSSEAETIGFLEERGYRVDSSLSQIGEAGGNCLVFRPS